MQITEEQMLDEGKAVEVHELYSMVFIDKVVAIIP